MSNRLNSRLVLRVGLICVVLILSACVQDEDKNELAGSATELGNVVGSLVTSDQRAAAGIPVSLYPLNSETSNTLIDTTDANGVFAFIAAPGAYRLLSLDGQGNGLTIDSIQTDGDAKVDLDRRTLLPLGGVSGYVRVTGARGGQVNLRLLGTPYTHPTSSDGAFDWQGIPAGRYWLYFDYPGAAVVELPLVIEPGIQTVISDTVQIMNNFSFGVSRSDTVILSSNQVPYTAYDRIYAQGFDSVYWQLNGITHAISPEDKMAPYLDIKSGSLAF